MNNLDFEEVYKFNGIDNLHCDLKGNFYFNNKPIKKVYNNGSLSVLIGKSKRGIKTLRKLAYKSTKEKEYSPF